MKLSYKIYVIFISLFAQQISAQEPVQYWGSEIKSDEILLKLADTDTFDFTKQLYMQDGVAQACGEESITEEKAFQYARNLLRHRTYFHNYIIFNSATNEPVGFFQACFLPNFRPAFNDIPNEYRSIVIELSTLDIGYIIDEKFRRQGYATKSVSLFAQFVTDHKDNYLTDEKIRALSASIEDYNQPSIKTVTTNNFKLHGDLKSDMGRRLYLRKI